MANNLMNDLFDLEVGTDREDYPRNLYSPHPVLSGVITRKGLAACALVVNAICLAIMIVLTVARGWPIVGFALGGFLLSAAYTAPPLRLKKHGLGEPTVLVVWGPLMVGGTLLRGDRHDPGRGHPRVAPVRAALHDGADGQAHRQDPVGRARRHAHAAGDHGRGRGPPADPGRCSSCSTSSIVALVIARVLPVASLLVVLSFPVLRRTFAYYSQPKPDVSPMPNPVWPLWFAALSFLVTRRAGGLFVLGLVIGAIARLVTQ